MPLTQPIFAFFLFHLSTVEMTLLSQLESYKTRHTSKVVSCKKNGTQYLIQCKDTIFFPTGGGQACDRGTLGGAKVLDVFGTHDATHVVDRAFQEGEKVEQIIDWDYRLDKMQQHTGQHLLSAIIDRMYNYSTEAWDCGPEVCNVELETKKKDLTDKEMRAIENECNRIITEGRNVSCHWHAPDDPEVKKAHTRGLPKGHDGGQLRIVSIDGIDHNLCCGTHVNNLHELQVLKLLKTSKAPKGRYLLHFIVGNRVLRTLHQIYNRERELSALIKGNPDTLIDLVQKNIDLSRKQNKYLGNVLKDLALLEARSVLNETLCHVVYRREGDLSYAGCFQREFVKQDLHPDAILIIISGDGPEANLLVWSQTAPPEDIGELICDAKLLDGAGRARDKTFNGKVKHPERHGKLKEVVRNYMVENYYRR